MSPHSRSGRNARSTAAPIIGHRLQRRAGAPLGVANRSVAFTKCGHHLDSQTLEPAFAFGTFLTPYCRASNADRRTACLTDC
jgi:hypothetical protein